MSLLLVCLSYGRNNEAVLHPILEERLKLTNKLYRKNKSKVLLLGGSNYQIKDNNDAPIGTVMESYLLDYIPSKSIETVKRAGDSTIEQLCYLREHVNKIDYSGTIVIISSQYFTSRVKLFCTYLFNDSRQIVEVKSAHVPIRYKARFGLVEEYKYFISKKWLKSFKKGDYLKILSEQRKFQKKVAEGKAWSPVS